MIDNDIAIKREAGHDLLRQKAPPPLGFNSGAKDESSSTDAAVASVHGIAGFGRIDVE